MIGPNRLKKRTPMKYKKLRCRHTMHGILVDGLVEVKCRHPKCGGPGVIVLHRFNPQTGKLVKTLRFREPIRKEVSNGSVSVRSAVRTA